MNKKFLVLVRLKPSDSENSGINKINTIIILYADDGINTINTIIILYAKNQVPILAWCSLPRYNEMC